MLVLRVLEVLGGSYVRNLRVLEGEDGGGGGGGGGGEATIIANPQVTSLRNARWSEPLGNIKTIIKT